MQAALRGRGHDVTLVDAAVSGDTTAGGRARLEWALGDGVDAALVELGANDGLRGLNPDTTEASLSAILDIEMNLHVKLCAGWGLSPSDLEQTPPAVEMLAYTRYVLDAGMRSDLLALKVALAPCVIGYAEIATRLASRPDAHAATNPYRVWIAEYAGAPYQEVAAKARAHLEALADLYATPAREAELIAIFKEATRLEADFWEMGWRAGQT